MKRPHHQQTWLNSLILSSVAVIFSVSDLEACECLRKAAVCQAAPASDSVFFGKVVRISNWSESAGSVEQQRVTFQVYETFIGPQTTTVDVMNGMVGLGVCSFEFKADQEYLVYASKSGSFLSTGICFRTATKERAAADLSYLRSLAKMESPSLIFGFVTASLPRGSGVPIGLQQEAQEAARPISKVLVQLETKAVQRQVLTDDLGNYSFVGLPPGLITLTVDLPKDLGGTQKRTFQLVERACSEQNFVTQ